MDRKQKWNYGFYGLFIIFAICWIIIMVNDKTKTIMNKAPAFLLLSIFFGYAFLYSVFNNEACIYGKITIKKQDNRRFYWIMTLFWGTTALLCLAFSIFIFINGSVTLNL